MNIATRSATVSFRLSALASAGRSARRPAAGFLVALVLVSASFAHEGHDAPPQPYPEADAHRPTPLPDRVVLTWTGDPATSQAVTWRTDVSVAHPITELAPASDGPQQAAATVPATTERLESDLGPALYHSARFTGLDPDTLYAYRVGDGVNWSEWFHFRTASKHADRFTFIYFGDAQNSVKTHWSRVFREAFREAPRAAFTLHAGDLINRANRDAEWGDWFAAPAWVHATIPVIATPGNHEYASIGEGPDNERIWVRADGSEIAVVVLEQAAITDTAGVVIGRRIVVSADDRRGECTVDAGGKILAADPVFVEITGRVLEEARGKPLRELVQDRQAEPGVRGLSLHWRPQFALPENGPAGLEETCYFLDYQGVRIISLNSNERQEEQASWLRGVLEQNPGRWSIVTCHHPMFSGVRRRDNPALRALWKPLFDEFRVDLVLQGHDHTYARGSIKNVPGGIQQAHDRESGTVYVISVSGPKMYDLDREPWMARVGEDTQLFQTITVDGDELYYEARTATGTLYDAFTLKKRGRRPNELIELLPMERLRPPPAGG